MSRIQTHTLVAALIALALTVQAAEANLICQKCSGSNCQRTEYNKFEDCEDELDVCVSIFDGQTLFAQGCWLSISPVVRSRCEKDSKLECNKCFTNRCNNEGPKSFQCIQCDSNQSAQCSLQAEMLNSTRCPIARSENAYCFAKLNGKQTVRGCSTTVKDQRSCLNDKNCALCIPGQLAGCNRMVIEEVIIGAGSALGPGSITLSLILSIAIACASYFFQY